MGLHQLGRFEQTARLALTFGGFLVVWEIIVRVAGIPAYILPPPSQILFDLWRKLPRLATAAAYTVQPMVLGFLTAVVVGVALALVIAFSRRLEGVVYPLLVFFQIIPKRPLRSGRSAPCRGKSTSPTSARSRTRLARSWPDSDASISSSTTPASSDRWRRRGSTRPKRSGMCST